METVNVERFIESLPPEMREKAEKCQSTDELIRFMNRHPLTDEALESVFGGKFKEIQHQSAVNNSKWTDMCPKRGGRLPHVAALQSVVNAICTFSCKFCGMNFYVKL